MNTLTHSSTDKLFKSVHYAGGRKETKKQFPRQMKSNKLWSINYHCPTKAAPIPRIQTWFNDPLTVPRVKSHHSSSETIFNAVAMEFCCVYFYLSAHVSHDNNFSSFMSMFAVPKMVRSNSMQSDHAFVDGFKT